MGDYSEHFHSLMGLEMVLYPRRTNPNPRGLRPDLASHQTKLSMTVAN